MPRYHFAKRNVALILAVGLVAISAAPVRAIGYYNLPGSFCQCFGYGNGAGHHACLVLGPLSCQGFCATNEVRLECPPQPPYACYGYGHCGSIEAGSWLNEPVMAPQQQPPPQTDVMPSPAAMRRQVLR